MNNLVPPPCKLFRIQAEIEIEGRYCCTKGTRRIWIEAG
jgi:hypothetical protein